MASAFCVLTRSNACAGVSRPRAANGIKAADLAQPRGRIVIFGVAPFPGIAAGPVAVQDQTAADPGAQDDAERVAVCAACGGAGPRPWQAIGVVENRRR